MISDKKIQTATLLKRNHDFILNMEISEYYSITV